MAEFRIVSSVLAIVVVILILFFLGPRRRGDLDQVELDVFLDEMSRFPNASRTYIDSQGVAFEAGKDGTYSGMRMEPVSILLLEKILFPVEEIRKLMDEGSPRFLIYREAVLSRTGD